MFLSKHLLNVWLQIKNIKNRNSFLINGGQIGQQGIFKIIIHVSVLIIGTCSLQQSVISWSNKWRLYFFFYFEDLI